MNLTVVGYWGAYPEQGEATSGYLFEKDGFHLLIDCGSGVMAQLPKYVNPYQLDAVLLTHYHQDHVADIGVLQYHMLVQNGLQKQDKVLPIYGHADDSEGLAMLDHQYTKGMAYDPTGRLVIGPFTIEFLATDHPVPCYAVRITDGQDTIVYTADSSYKPEFVSFSQAADLLITDCNFYQGQDGKEAGHMNSQQCGEIATAADVGTLLLSHHPHFGDREQLVVEAKRFYQGSVVLAHSGYKWKKQ
ncbi:MBL fold metallo-hydrolase [Amphibacillus sediminis]|uniref:MBL fold metallo-hydrolase n=1 Tax=Amphibacillus sediminis TaxID=360185 RepID=UPI00082EB63C|nr:MBL fold metallo-hydrolase [Amphibacillus sediminis]